MYVKPQLASKINLTPHPSKKKQTNWKQIQKTLLDTNYSVRWKANFLKKNYFILRAREERAFNLHSAGYRI